MSAKYVPVAEIEFVTSRDRWPGRRPGCPGEIVTTSTADSTAAFCISSMKPCWSTVGGIACWTFRMVSRFAGASVCAACRAANCAPSVACLLCSSARAAFASFT